MNIVHTLSMKQIDNNGKKIIASYEVKAETDYQIELIKHNEIELKVLKHLGQKIRIIDITKVPPTDIKSSKEALLKKAIEIFDNPNDYDFSFNCHAYSFLHPYIAWFDDYDSIQNLIKAKYKEVKEDANEENDIYLFKRDNEFVHSARIIQNRFSHKKGTEPISESVDIKEIMEMYPNTTVVHLRIK